MTWRLYALLSGGAFVATYLVSGQPGTLAPARPAQPQAAAVAAAPSHAENEIQQLAARLERRVREAASYHTPTRNPFDFGHVPPPKPKRVIAPKLPEVPVVVAPPPPPFTLSGIAVNHVDGALQRTAVFATQTGVVLAREGDVVGGFKVMTIEDDAAVLESTFDASSHRLALSRR
jgi:hypothetical protein